MTETTLHFSIGGMSCAGCSGAVERVARKQPGVTTATVNLALETAEIVFDHADPDPAAVIAAIEKAGFSATVQHGSAPSAEDLDTKAGRSGWIVVVSVLLALPFVVHMAMMMSTGHGILAPWLQLVLATPVQWLIGWRFHTGTVQALKRRAANMDVLISLGTSVAYFYSLWLVLSTSAMAGLHLYFEASTMIITMVLFGKWLEDRAKRSASAAIHALMSLRPEQACVRRNGTDITIPVDQVRIGDIVVLKPGERIPVDGVITEGATDADESLITGESLPIHKTVGDALVAGAINGNGLVLMAAQKIGVDTTLGKIIKLVSAAQTGKAPIQRLVDKVAAEFVQIVVSIAAVTFVCWWISGSSMDQTVAAAVSVLVIACPCALGLATPAALVAGTGSAAKAGILIRDIETLERAAAVDTVVFDKTGTLTRGHPELVNIHSLGDRTELLRLIAAAQQGSEHPLARSVIKSAVKGAQNTLGEIDLPPVTNFMAIGGAGLTAEVEDCTILIGTSKLLHDHNISTAPLDGVAANWQGVGQTTSFIAIDGQLAGVIGFRDTVRPESQGTILDLKYKGITSWILSGDTPIAVKTIAQELGISNSEGRATPADKAAKIQELQSGNKHVAMVGDGINDAPALAQADVSIAMGSGTDVAIATAGITLMRPNPRLVGATLQIARKTHRIIRQNLFWAFAYNAIGIPLAAFGVLHPSFAGAAMALSSVSVVGNALRLKSWKPEKL